MVNILLLEKAFSQYGITEIAGENDNPEVVKYFEKIGFHNLKDEVAWCSAFMNWAAKEAGLEHSGKLNARSWLKVGDPVEVPHVGDVAVFWRESPTSWKGHVGIYINEDENNIFVLGGNQSNMVTIRPYSKTRLLGYRRLNKVNQ